VTCSSATVALSYRITDANYITVLNHRSKQMCNITVSCRSQWSSQDFTLGGTEAERRRRENEGAGGAEGLKIGQGISPSPTDYRVWGSVVSSPSRVGCKPRPPSHFLAYLRPQNTSGRENSVTLLNKAGPTSHQNQFFP